jgi:signal peptidase I
MKAMRRQKSTLRLVAEPLLIATALAFAVRASARIYSIPSLSMAPALQVGDHIIVTPYRFGEPERGDVVVFRSPANDRELIVKRIVGLPGDLIDSRLGRVRIASHTLSEPYLARPAATGAIEAQIIPADSFFVMGDNRDSSYDSRHWGPLPKHLVVGRARMVLWSASSADAPAAHASTAQIVSMRSARLRLSRIFKCIE